MKQRKRVTYGFGLLSKPSMPEFPGWPSRNNVDGWLKARREIEERGIKLLLEHYARDRVRNYHGLRSVLEGQAIVLSGLQSETERLRALVIALATDHVPFFRPRSKKRATIDNHVLATLFNNYQQERRRGRSPKEARHGAKIAKNLQGKLDRASDGRLKNLLVQARTKFRALISIAPDGSIKPRGDFEARIWHFHLNGAGHARRSKDGVMEWSATDREGVVVSWSQITE